tara:strand:- start:12 stop:395 length:384 start_codon:yes stop_codon:yes gene_type:complete
MIINNTQKTQATQATQGPQSAGTELIEYWNGNFWSRYMVIWEAVECSWGWDVEDKTQYPRIGTRYECTVFIVVQGQYDFVAKFRTLGWFKDWLIKSQGLPRDSVKRFHPVIDSKSKNANMHTIKERG